MRPQLLGRDPTVLSLMIRVDGRESRINRIDRFARLLAATPFALQKNRTRRRRSGRHRHRRRCLSSLRARECDGVCVSLRQRERQRARRHERAFAFFLFACSAAASARQLAFSSSTAYKRCAIERACSTGLIEFSNCDCRFESSQASPITRASKFLLRSAQASAGTTSRA